SDSAISIALEHYDRSGADPDKRMRSLLYRGCVATERGNDTLAMRYYKLAQQRCPTADRFHQGYIHFRIADLYQGKLETKQAIKHYKAVCRTLNEFAPNIYLTKSCICIGQLYRMDNKDSAMLYLTKGIELARLSSDSVMISNGYEQLAACYYNFNDYARAIQFASRAMDYSANGVVTEAPYYYACQSYLKLGAKDSAQYIFSKMPSPITSVDRIEYYECVAALAEANGDIPNSKRLYDIAYDIGDSVRNATMNNGLISAEKNCEITSVKKEKGNMTRMLLWAVAGIVLLAIAVLFLHQRLRRHRLQVLAQSTDINALKQQTESLLQQLTQLRRQQQADTRTQQLASRINELQAATDRSFEKYGEVLHGLLYTSKGGKAVKDERIAELMDSNFFAQLQALVNARHDNLITKLENGPYKLSEQDINIICLELCHFPNAVLWAYLDTNDVRSVYNKKNYIIKKIGIVKKIDELPAYFASTPTTPA
ncbi:MAG: hypothetical protein KBT10_02965, partial [Bacteroidales bacterium]|nr:hypothetical protein [Candidatus Sodaliphilus aphodohippi]